MIDRTSLNSAYCKGTYCTRKNELLFGEIKTKIKVKIKKSEQIIKPKKKTYAETVITNYRGIPPIVVTPPALESPQ